MLTLPRIHVLYTPFLLFKFERWISYLDPLLDRNGFQKHSLKPRQNIAVKKPEKGIKLSLLKI